MRYEIVERQSTDVVESRASLSGFLPGDIPKARWAPGEEGKGGGESRKCQNILSSSGADRGRIGDDWEEEEIGQREEIKETIIFAKRWQKRAQWTGISCRSLAPFLVTKESLFLTL